MQSIGDNLTDVVLPPLNRFADLLHNISDWTNPRTGNPAVGMGVMAAGGVDAFLLARSLLGRMGPWGRTLLGGAGGMLLGGDVSSLLMGAMIGRGFGSAGGISTALAGTGAAAAGVAGAAAGRAWGTRFLGAIARFARGTLVWSAVGVGASEIVTHWDKISRDLKGIWEDLRKSAPTWLWGEGKPQSEGFQQLGRDVDRYAAVNRTWLEDLIMGTGVGQWLHARGMIRTEAERREASRLRGLDQDAQDTLAMGYGSRPITVTGNPITINITAPPGASPQAIGEAAGNAVQSGLRGALSDLPPMP
jgi:hypothetical protein